jgi:acyl-CoA reductase-like NAD-dependent aldehyde dehydrogenase
MTNRTPVREPLHSRSFAKGFWMQPTVFTGVSSGMEIVRDEIFGPVPIIQRFSTLEEAIGMATSLLIEEYPNSCQDVYNVSRNIGFHSRGKKS